MQVDLHLPRLNFLRYDWYMPLVLSRELCNPLIILVEVFKWPKGPVVFTSHIWEGFPR